MQLVNIGQQLTMSSRDIADLVGSRHGDVMRSIERLMEKGVVSGYAPSAYTHEQNGAEYKEYLIGKRDTYVIVAQLSPEFTAKLVDRWQELESAQTFQVPTTLSGALRLAAEQAEVIEKQSAQLAIAAPKAQFFDKVVERGTLMTASQVGQKFKMAAVTLNKNLEAFNVYNKGIKRSRVFQQWFIDKGYGELKQTELGHSQALFTTAGEAWVIEKLTGEGVI